MSENKWYALMEVEGKNLANDVKESLRFLNRKYPNSPVLCYGPPTITETVIEGLPIMPKKTVNSKNLEFWYKGDPRKVKVETDN